MDINLNKLKYYVLSVGNKEKENHITDSLKNLDIKFVKPILGINKKQSGATGFCRIIDLAIKEQDNHFKPFVILEDDISIFKWEDNIRIPQNTDLLYLGVSKAGMYKEKHCYEVYTSKVDNFSNLLRIYNMCSTHAILVCNVKGALILQKCVTEDYFKKRGWDMTLAHIQPYYNIYSLKTPIFFQDKMYGGQEDNTKIILENDNDVKLMNKEFYNTQNYSFITNVNIDNINDTNVIFRNENKISKNINLQQKNKYFPLLMVIIFLLMIYKKIRI